MVIICHYYFYSYVKLFLLKVVDDILKTLKMGEGAGVKKYKIPCFRKNLFYDVRFKDLIEVSIMSSLWVTNKMGLPFLSERLKNEYQ